jgi:hypothetical protein
MAIHDGEFDAILDRVDAAGLGEVYTDEDGTQAMRLTPDGERVVRQLAMLGRAGVNSCWGRGQGGAGQGGTEKANPRGTDLGGS